MTVTTRNALLAREAYVAWLIETAPAAREIAVQYLKCGGAATDMLQAMYEKDAVKMLGHDLGCSDAAAFEELADRITEDFRRPLPRFSAEHLKQLAKGPIRRGVRGKLGSHLPDEILEYLFDKARMRRSLREVDRRLADKSAFHAEALLLAMLQAQLGFETHFAIVGDDWGAFLDQAQWIRRDAADDLLEAAVSRQWDTDSIPCVLAALINEAYDEDDAYQDRPSPTWRFDGLAVSYLKGRLNLAAEDLGKLALGRSHQALEKGSKYSAIRELPVWLNFHRGFIGSSVEFMLSGLKWDTVRSVVGEENCKLEEFDERPIQTQPFAVELGNPVAVEPSSQEPSGVVQLVWKKVFGKPTEPQPRKRVRSIAVYCDVHAGGANERRLVLKCPDLPEEVAYAVERALERVTPGDLDPDADSVADGVLALHMPEVAAGIDMVVGAIREIVPELTLCIVLCGTTVDLGTESPWSEDLNELLKEPPYPASQNTQNDVRFKKTANAICDEVLTRYESEGRTVVRV